MAKVRATVLADWGDSSGDTVAAMVVAVVEAVTVVASSVVVTGGNAAGDDAGRRPSVGSNTRGAGGGRTGRCGEGVGSPPGEMTTARTCELAAASTGEGEAAEVEVGTRRIGECCCRWGWGGD